MATSLPPRCRVLIFDLGDVLFSWSPVTSTSISPRTLKAILSSTIWQQYERGRLSEDECYRLSGEKFSLDPEEVRQAIHDARESLQPDNAFIRFIGELKAETQGTLRIFAMSNISAPDYAVARAKPAEWGIFDRVFTSAAAGMRKPDLCFFKFVLDEIKTEPSSVVFIDDRFENVLAARSLGINGILFDDIKRVRQALQYYVGDPVSRGLTFLESRAGRLESETNLGHNITENFAQLLILEATNNHKLVNYVIILVPGTFSEVSKRHYKPILTTDEFPADLDTTSIGLMVTQPDDHVFDSVMDEMLRHMTEDGISMTYFDAERPRTDPIVSLNVLSLFYSRGRGHELASTLDWVLNVLEYRAYLDGTRYYETAECFLFFASRLLRTTLDASLHTQLTPLLRERILERAGSHGDALALSMRVLAGSIVGLRMERDRAALLPLQCEDGGWEASWIYKYGSSGVKIGNRGLTTALALNAITSFEPELRRQTQPQSRLPLQLSGPGSALETESLSLLLPKDNRSATPSPLHVATTRGLATGLPSPPPSPPPQSPKRAKHERRFSAGAIAKGVYTYLFTDAGTRKRRQNSSVCHKSSIGSG
ncbi:HAD-like domain-containing protein [Multifurca ochricompacta]|uniref:HAD-like domain-containing protein n=1 Tax=Multifurca ochricompacta TaxID=376703 RepID=A0AAD4QNL3_9AGAM|nr:HAD-like domain-containing protein [Multifurca ochricompacta]